MKKIIVNNGRIITVNGNALFEYARELPTGYTEVEYIENTSNAYLDTGVTPGCTIPIITAQGDSSITGSAILVASLTSGGHWVGARSDGNWGNGGGDLAVAVSTKIDLYVNIQPSAIVFSIVGGERYTVTAATTITTSVWLFAGNPSSGNSYPFKGKIYGDVVITKSNLPVFHGIPCLNPSNVAGWYDVVTDSFKPSSNSTPFVAGPPII